MTPAGPELESPLREVFARETALFDAYGAAIRGTRDRGAREAFLLGQAAAARTRGRLLAELERLAVSYGREEDEVEVEPRIAALHAAESRQADLYRAIERAAGTAGDERLGKLVRELAEMHERRREALAAIGSEAEPG